MTQQSNSLHTLFYDSAFSASDSRLSFIRNHPLYTSYYQRLTELEKERLFCRHQMDHFLDVARIAYILNLEMGLGINRDMVYAAALLHDIGKSRQYEEGIPHETARSEGRSARICSAILAFPPEEQQQILTAIHGHRKLRETPEPLEFLLYKSDKMSRACFSCPVEPACNWSDEKKNKEIRL